MAVGRTRSVAMLGLDGALVEIEADIAAGLPQFALIGLPDAALAQAKDRVRAAATNAGLPLSHHRITVGLSPASLPKHGSGFDLGIALAALAADDAVPAESLDRVVHIGELGLDGRVRPVAGVLPAVAAARRAGVGTVMVPAANAHEASLVPGVRVVGVASLREAAIWHGAQLDPEPVDPVLGAPSEERGAPEGDLAEIIGNDDAIDAMVVAAAGGHHVFLLGPPGAGKTMLASRLPTILPPLDGEAALEVASLRSLAGLPVGATLDDRPPFEQPHHTASAVSLIGGGSGVIRPGAAARASRGVLFLDEAPEFAAVALDALRQPLESGTITIHRAKAVAQFPGAFQLVLAANPCPCGQWGAKDADCSCTPFARRRYLARLSGPLLDRVDIQLHITRVTAGQLALATERGGRLDSATARERVIAARARAAERLHGTPWRINSEVPGVWFRSDSIRLPASATAPIDRALERGAITMRGYDRILRVAWTLADLDEASRPGIDHVGRALYFRRAI
ncbi:YifB family Mg chelatase-like AAA ATPase [Galbitalea sp. SE-J8]|uniref:YifB family Mg chelatase-like AAA ATPase n=1 Tax=Galbitalea sp. SE-J8 TaxID=3054952 RepID=UPI00259D06A6|nr:YifB family Mg chelatase-like AAA ATPase [Galbitalea sp. SE-J8]MDM4762897.1 YifB family Mg chelatase-like AAA ATPase [Galbitalea sp. SE-J8]